MTLASLLSVVVPDLVLGGLVLWRILGPPCPSMRATCVFAAGTILSLGGLLTGVIVTLGSL